MARLSDLLLLDNNTIRKLEYGPARRRLEANLRATGREFWPTGMNVMEALKSRDRETRTRLLTSLARLAGDAHAFPMPTEALRNVAEAFATDSPTITWAEPRFTNLFRNPEDVTDEQAAEVRNHLEEQERSFDAAHERAKEELVPALKAQGGRDKWPDVASFLDQVWNSRSHLEQYVIALWEQWGFPKPAPVDKILADRAWLLYFEGWGAAVYARLLAHPQPPKVEHSDLVQLVYCGSAKSTVFASDDAGFRQLGNEILRGRHQAMEIVPLAVMAS